MHHYIKIFLLLIAVHLMISDVYSQIIHTEEDIDKLISSVNVISAGNGVATFKIVDIYIDGSPVIIHSKNEMDLINKLIIMQDKHDVEVMVSIKISFEKILKGDRTEFIYEIITRPKKIKRLKELSVNTIKNKLIFIHKVKNVIMPNIYEYHVLYK